MSKVLVIGASSFSGRHFCEYLRERECEVCEQSARQVFLWGNQTEYIVNFAAANVVAPSWDYPHGYMESNLDFAIRIADSHRHGALPHLKRYVHISTPEVYGNAGVSPIKEDTPFAPSTPYAVSRAAAEWMLQAYRKSFGFPVVFTRACNVYGPGQQLYRLIPKVMASIKHGIRFPLEGGGASYRQFIHVHDLCDAYWRVMLHGQIGEAYHVGSDVTLRIETLVRLICAGMGLDWEDVVEVTPDRPGKDPAYILDSTKMKALGWEANITMPDGIEEVRQWMNLNWELLKHQSLTYEHRP
jgi:dTDP-glucose 4,6-dehydratase